jgi:hypothetical protein
MEARVPTLPLLMKVRMRIHLKISKMQKIQKNQIQILQKIDLAIMIQIMRVPLKKMRIIGLLNKHLKMS